MCRPAAVSRLQSSDVSMVAKPSVNKLSACGNVPNRLSGLICSELIDFDYLHFI
jgi:hypothetical protein